MPYINPDNCSLLLHCDGTDASTTFTDSSPNNHTVTAVGNAQIDTAWFKFGTASLLHDGTGDYLSVADHASLNFSTGPVTIAAWEIFTNAIGAGDVRRICGKGDITATNGAWAFGYGTNVGWGTGHRINFAYRSGGVIYDIISSEVTLNTSTEYHIALSKSGSTVRLFLNGTQVASGTITEALDSIGSSLLIGRAAHSADEDMDGRQDEILITKEALYTSNFTPPTDEYIPSTLGDLDLNIPFISHSLEGAGELDLIIPIPTIEFNGATYGFQLQIPTLLGSFESGGIATLTIPNFTGSFSGYNEIGSFNLTLPFVTSYLTGSSSNYPHGLFGTLPFITFEGTGSNGGNLNGILPLISFSGTSGGYLDISLPNIITNLIGSNHSTGNLNVSIPIIKSGLTGLNGNNGTLDISIPFLTSVLTGASDTHGSFSLSIPFITASLKSFSPTYSCIIYNIKSGAVTEYTNFNFSSIVEFNGNVYAANETGIYLLGGTTDQGTKIVGKIRLHDNDFGTAIKKRFDNIWIDGSEYSIKEIVDRETLEPALKSSRGRVKFGKGTNGKVIALEIENQYNKDLDIDSIEFEVNVSDQRRVKN